MPAIHDYGYRPIPDFGYRNNERPESLTFGVELEVDYTEDSTDAQRYAREETAQAIVDAADGRLYIKRDGSLTGGGFEIVSHPGTLAHHLYEMRWANTMRLAKHGGLKSHDTTTCGLHIHVGRAGLGTDDYSRRIAAANLVLLAHALKEPLTKFSRREESRLTDWARFPRLPSNIGQYGQADVVDAALDTESDDRYQAVNLCNSATIEIRIFRGTLKRDTLAAALELVSNLCEYAMTHTPHECLSATFADIVNISPRKELLAYCQSKRLIRTQVVAA